MDLLGYIGRTMGKPPGWERVVRRLVPPEKCRTLQDLLVFRDGALFLAQPSLPLGWNVALFGTYEPQLRDLMRGILSTGCVAIDVGANTGWHSLLMALLVGHQGSVLAIEANPSVREILSFNLHVNKLSQVHILPFAAAASEGEVKFFAPKADDADSGNGHVACEEVGTGSEIVPVRSRTLDQMVTEQALKRCDLIKIDVEGYEWPVLQGAQKTITEFRPAVAFEYVPEYAQRGGGSPGLFTEYFSSLNYRLFTIQRNWLESASEASWQGSTDFWAVPL